MATLARLNIVVNSAAARSALGSFNQAVQASGNLVGRTARGMSGAFNAVRGAVFSLQGAIASLGVALSVRSIVQTTLEAERLRTAFAALDGDAQQAARTFNELRARSNELGVDFMATANSYKVFGLAARAAGVDLNETNRIFNAFLTAGAAMKMSNDDLEGSLRAVAQMFSKGTVQAEELRGQLGERLPVAFSMAAQSMGVTTMELGKMLENGEVLAVDLVPKLATALQDQFGQAAIEASYSATAQFNRFGNTITDLKIALGESGLVGALADVATATVDFVRSEAFSDWVYNTLMGFADFVDSAAAVYNKFGDIGKGIRYVYDELKAMYNRVNDFTGGYLMEMGLIGYILLGKRKGGFIGIMVALLAAAADQITIWATDTIASVVTAAKNAMGGIIDPTGDTVRSYADRSREGGHVGRNFRNRFANAGAYHEHMIGEGYTAADDGTYFRRSSMVPGAVSVYDALETAEGYLQEESRKISEREQGFLRVMDDAFDALYSTIGLTPGANMGDLPSITPPGQNTEQSYPGDRIRGVVELLRQKMQESLAANSGPSGFGTTTGELPEFSGPISKEALAAQRAFDKLDKGIIKTWDDLKFFTENGGDLTKRFSDGMKQGFEQALISAVDLKQAGIDLVAKGFQFLDSAIDGFINGTKVSFKQFTADILAYLAKLYVRMLIFKTLSGTVLGDFLGIPAGQGFGQAAGGGAIQARQPYIVGERGPEVFYPRTGGHMVPNGGSGGGGVTINNHYDFSNADDSAAARLQATAETIKNETFNQVFGAIEQGGRFAKATGRR